MRHAVQILRRAIFAELDRLFDLPAIVGCLAVVFAETRFRSCVFAFGQGEEEISRAGCFLRFIRNIRSSVA